MDLEFVCSKCGAALDDEGFSRSQRIQIIPCASCLKDERKDGRDEGYQDGLDECECPETEDE